MKYVLMILFLTLGLGLSGNAEAKGAPLFFQTGDELFEIEGAPELEGGYSVGYHCQRFGLFGADLWTWDCEIKAISLEEFAAGDLDESVKAEMEAQFSLSDRKRDPWNQYGFIAIILALIGFAVVKLKGSKS